MSTPAARDIQVVPRDRQDPDVRHTTGGTLMYVGNGLEAYRVETFETKEPETIAWIRELVDDGDVFFDVGANVGIYSLYAALVHPGCTVFAFEPFVVNVARLHENVRLNALGNVITLPIGISDKSRLETFFVPDPRAGGSGGQIGQPIDEHGQPFDPVDRHAVVTHSLDACISLLGLPLPQHVKIDVDGAEMRVLDGMSETLARPELRSLLVEVNTTTTSLDAVISRLSDRGFSTSNRFNDHPSHSRNRRRGTPTEGAVNVIAVRSSASRREGGAT